MSDAEIVSSDGMADSEDYIRMCKALPVLSNHRDMFSFHTSIGSEAIADLFPLCFPSEPFLFDAYLSIEPILPENPIVLTQQ